VPIGNPWGLEMKLSFKKLLKADWEIFAGLAAAIAVIVLKFLHLIHVETMLTLAIVMLAGLFLRELRRETVIDKFIEDIADIQMSVKQLTLAQADQGSSLITPAAMNVAMSTFSKRACGTCVFKHVSPFMFKKDANFNAFLKPMLERDAVNEVIFIIMHDEKETYDRYVRSKIDACEGGSKVAEVITADNPDANGIIACNCGLTEGFEALITFFSEPFMIKIGEHMVPKFALHVLPNSEVSNLVSDNVRRYLTFN